MHSTDFEYLWRSLGTERMLEPSPVKTSKISGSSVHRRQQNSCINHIGDQIMTKFSLPKGSSFPRRLARRASSSSSSASDDLCPEKEPGWDRDYRIEPTLFIPGITGKARCLEIARPRQSENLVETFPTITDTRRRDLLVQTQTLQSLSDPNIKQLNKLLSVPGDSAKSLHSEGYIEQCQRQQTRKHLDEVLEMTKELERGQKRLKKKQAKLLWELKAIA